MDHTRTKKGCPVFPPFLSYSSGWMTIDDLWITKGTSNTKVSLKTLPTRLGRESHKKIIDLDSLFKDNVIDTWGGLFEWHDK